MTSLTRRGLLLLALMTTVVGCRKSDYYCPGAPDDNCNNIDAPDPPECTSSAQCSAPKPVCDLATQTCVACTASDHNACVGTTPICGSDQTCHPCTAHTDCVSNACLPDGACGDDTNVAYVDPMGTDNPTCTKGSPCTKLDKALATNRKHVKFHGRTNAQVTLTRDVVLLADPGAQLSDTGLGILIRVEGASKVAIYDLEITSALGINNAGISLQPGNTATVSLTRANVTGNGGAGISVSGGTLTVTQSTLSGNAGGGISVTGGTLTVTQSTLSGNAGGGIAVTGVGATFDITNNFIFRNGDQDMSAFGGLNLGITMPGSNRLEFNTIVDNRAAIASGGVICGVATFSAPNNIIARNSVAGSTTAPGAQTSAGCAYPTSRVQNDVSGLGFIDPEAPAPFDYKLTGVSNVIDQATTPSTVVIDYDADARPQGGQKDIGADEYRP